jgi:hypothetical protein
MTKAYFNGIEKKLLANLPKAAQDIKIAVAWVYQCPFI